MAEVEKSSGAMSLHVALRRLVTDATEDQIKAAEESVVRHLDGVGLLYGLDRMVPRLYDSDEKAEQRFDQLWERVYAATEDWVLDQHNEPLPTTEEGELRDLRGWTATLGDYIGGELADVVEYWNLAVLSDYLDLRDQTGAGSKVGDVRNLEIIQRSHVALDLAQRKSVKAGIFASFKLRERGEATAFNVGRVPAPELAAIFNTSENYVRRTASKFEGRLKDLAWDDKAKRRCGEFDPRPYVEPGNGVFGRWTKRNDEGDVR